MTGLLTDARLWLALMCLCEPLCEMGTAPDLIDLLRERWWTYPRLEFLERWRGDDEPVLPSSGIVAVAVCAWMAAYLTVRAIASPLPSSLMALALVAAGRAVLVEAGPDIPARLSALRVGAAFAAVVLSAPACAAVRHGATGGWDALRWDDLAWACLPLLAVPAVVSMREAWSLRPSACPFTDIKWGEVLVYSHAPFRRFVPLLVCWLVCLSAPLAVAVDAYARA